MKVSNTVNMTKKNNGTYVIEVNGVTNVVDSTNPQYSVLGCAYTDLKNVGEVNRPTLLATMAGDSYYKDIMDWFDYATATTEEVAEDVRTPEEKVLTALENLTKFFSEFEFEPNFRFLNTLAKMAQKSEKDAKDYITNYFALVDSAYQNEIYDKLKSKEFKTILEDFKAVAPTHTVNNRFKIYYGSQGTGKTTKAQKETSNRCVVCNNSMLPADLMEDFTFESGNATFKPSALWDCMENGLPIVLDEINLLPFESLRFLQGILDNKAEFTYKGKTVHINEGFAIIGTMNLTVNGATFGLPEPLVDRSAELKKFVLTPKDLLSAII